MRFGEACSKFFSAHVHGVQHTLHSRTRAASAANLSYNVKRATNSSHVAVGQHTHMPPGVKSEAWCRICLMLPSTYLRDGAALITLHLPSKMCATCASHTMHSTDQRQQARLSPK